MENPDIDAASVNQPAVIERRQGVPAIKQNARVIAGGVDPLFSRGRSAAR
jgi:hypothetical protein